MRIVLKRDWDISSQPPGRIREGKAGHFVGRQHELSVLTNELMRRNQGAILVSGYRGVGKTSFVYKALQDVSERYAGTDDHIIVVLMNSNSLEVSKDKRQIIINLIRRLYTSSAEAELPDSVRAEIEGLYKKAVSSEFKYVEAAEDGRRVAREVGSEVSVSTDGFGITQLFWVVCFVLAIVMQFSPPSWAPNWFNSLVPLLLALPVPYLLTLGWNYRRSTKQSETSSDSAQHLYTMDNNLSNLEFDLDKVHQLLSDEGIKTIYVIDELDKLNKSEVDGVLKYFKNLFTLSSAMFIFIGAEDLYQIGRSQQEAQSEVATTAQYRPHDYTYFTSRYSLARPSDEELMEFVDEVTESATGAINPGEFDTLKRAFILEANGDYFDLLQLMKGSITDFDGELPVIEKDLDEVVTKASALQQLLSLLFYQKYFAPYPAKWAENEWFLRDLYWTANRVFMSRSGAMVAGVKYSHEVEELSAGDDFLRYLTKLGILELVSGTGSRWEGRQNETDESRSYQVTGFMPETLPSTLEYRSFLDEELINRVETFYAMVVNLWNMDAGIGGSPSITVAMLAEQPELYLDKFRYWGWDLKAAIRVVDPIYQQVTDSSLVLRHEELESYLEAVAVETQRLREDAHLIVANLIKRAMLERQYSASELQEPNAKIPLKLTEITKQVLSAGVSFTLLTDTASSYPSLSILVCNSPFYQQSDKLSLYDFQHRHNSNWAVIVLEDKDERLPYEIPDPDDGWRSQTVAMCVKDFALQREHSLQELADFAMFIKTPGSRREEQYDRHAPDPGPLRD